MLTFVKSATLIGSPPVSLGTSAPRTASITRMRWSYSIVGSSSTDASWSSGCDCLRARTCSFNAAFPGWYSATAQQPVQYHPTKRMEVDFNYRYLLPGQHAELNLRAQGPYYDGYFMLEWFSPIAGDDQWHHHADGPTDKPNHGQR